LNQIYLHLKVNLLKEISNVLFSGLKEEYYSLRLNSFDNISGIPDDETLLNPVLTAEEIERGELLDYSLSENKFQDKIPSTFKSQAVKEEN